MFKFLIVVLGKLEEFLKEPHHLFIPIGVLASVVSTWMVAGVWYLGSSSLFPSDPRPSPDVLSAWFLLGITFSGLLVIHALWFAYLFRLVRVSRERDNSLTNQTEASKESASD